MADLFFFIFASLLIFGALRVVLAKDIVHAVLYLVFVFFQASALWILLKAEFLAITLVLVYVGAVMVLFLFVVMMLDVKVEASSRGRWLNLPAAFVLAGIVALELIGLVFGVRAIPETAVQGNLGSLSNTQLLGQMLYTQYAIPVQVAAVILLVAIISAIALTLRDRKDSKYVDPSEQVRVRASDRVFLVPGFKRKE